MSGDAWEGARRPLVGIGGNGAGEGLVGAHSVELTPEGVEAASLAAKLRAGERPGCQRRGLRRRWGTSWCRRRMLWMVPLEGSVHSG